MAKNIIIRVDGNSSIGLGHIYRGIALAEMLKVEFSITFIIKVNTETTPITDAGFNYNFIPANIELLDEPQYFNNILQKKTIIVLDGYDFIEEYQQKIKKYNFKLIYIDDLVIGTQKADLVINHSPGIKKSDYKTEPYTKLALGLDYAILRPAFLEAAKQKRIITKIDTAFICFGGSDIYDLTLKVTKALLNIKQFKKINIVVGSAYKHKEIFNIKKNNSKINIYKDLLENELISVMYDSNFAVVPTSTILFELLAIRIPMLTGYYANNQKHFYQYLSDNKIIFGVEDFTKIDTVNLKSKILKFIKNSFRNKKIIDGNQEQRIIELIKSL